MSTDSASSAAPVAAPVTAPSVADAVPPPQPSVEQVLIPGANVGAAEFTDVTDLDVQDEWTSFELGMLITFVVLAAAIILYMAIKLYRAYNLPASKVSIDALALGGADAAAPEVMKGGATTMPENKPTIAVQIAAAPVVDDDQYQF